jgi:hypothetical protein
VVLPAPPDVMINAFGCYQKKGRIFTSVQVVHKKREWSEERIDNVICMLTARCTGGFWVRNQRYVPLNVGDLGEEALNFNRRCCAARVPMQHRLGSHFLSDA